MPVCRHLHVESCIPSQKQILDVFYQHSRLFFVQSVTKFSHASMAFKASYVYYVAVNWTGLRQYPLSEF